MACATFCGELTTIVMNSNTFQEVLYLSHSASETARAIHYRYEMGSRDLTATDWECAHSFLNGSESSLADFVRRYDVSICAVHKVIYAGLYLRSLHLQETISVVGALPYKDHTVTILARTMFELMLDSLWISNLCADNYDAEADICCQKIRNRIISYFERQRWHVWDYYRSIKGTGSQQADAKGRMQGGVDTYPSSIEKKARFVGKKDVYQKEYPFLSYMVHGQTLDMSRLNVVRLLYKASEDFLTILIVCLRVYNIPLGEISDLKAEFERFKEDNTLKPE